MKKFICLAVSLLMLTTVMAGCFKKPVPNTNETLEVYCLDAGYGSRWVEDMLTEFKAQEWVKEKYPNLTTLFQHNDSYAFAASKINAGGKNNTIDLLFSALDASFQGSEKLVDLTTPVYKQLVPGEAVTFEEKALDSYNASNKFIDVTNLDGDPKYYFVSWASGMDGFVYNADILAQLEIAVPNTTDELEAACAKIASLKDNTAGKYKLGYSFIQSKEADYWSYLFNIFWAQYEGIDGFLNFWNGIDDNRLSMGIFDQLGRVRSLEVYEELLKYQKGYLNQSSSTYDFMVAQTMFLQGNGVFHVNGDWLDNEMAKKKQEIKDKEGIDYDIKMMKTPIVSSIVEKLEDSSMTDETLSALITAIDNGETSFEGVSASDFEYVKTARTVIHSIGTNHTGAIPSYAVGKDVAIDFVRFMSTDIANQSYMKSTNGASLPFDYNVKVKNPEFYKGLSTFQKSRLDYIFSDSYEPYVLPQETAFPLSRFGNLKAFQSTNYYSTFKSDGNTKKPMDFFNETKGAWSQNQWNTALSKAGLIAQ